MGINPKRYYVNCSTGEVSSDRVVARNWMRAGNDVEYYHNGRMAIRFNSLGI